MSEMKPCPFCGSEAITTTFIDPDDFEYMPIEVNDCDAEVTCENERCINGWYLSPKAWNSRPIEDALRARIAELERQLDERNDNQWIKDMKAENNAMLARAEKAEAENAALKPYRDGYDPATVFPPEGVWVWLRDCDDNVELVQYNPNAGFYWNYSPNDDGDRFSYWEADNVDLIRWYPEPPMPEVESNCPRCGGDGFIVVGDTPDEFTTIECPECKKERAQ